MASFPRPTSWPRSRPSAAKARTSFRISSRTGSATLVRSRLPPRTSSACRCSTSTPSISTLTPSSSSGQAAARSIACLPLFRRGKRLFLAVADPTNLHAIDEIKFQTGLGIEAIVVEDDKLQKARRQGDRAGRHARCRASTTRTRLRPRESRGHRRRRGIGDGDHARRRRRRADRALRQQGHARRHPARRLGHPLRALREDLPRSPAHGRRAEGNRAAAGAARR